LAALDSLSLLGGARAASVVLVSIAMPVGLIFVVSQALQATCINMLIQDNDEMCRAFVSMGIDRNKTFDRSFASSCGDFADFLLSIANF